MIQAAVDRSRIWDLEGNSAEAYERYLVPLFFAPGAQYLMELAPLEEGERVLDVACGTGIVARSAAPRLGPNGLVVGLDLNESMLAVARKASTAIQAPIEWWNGNAADMPFPEQAFDVVFCQQGLQFFPDRLAALREMHRVLALNGRLALSVLRGTQHNPGYLLLAETLEHHVGAEAGAMMRSPFLPLSPVELRDLVTSAGFRDVHVTIGIGPVRYPSAEEFLRQEAASSPLAGSLGSAIEKIGEVLLRDLRKALAAYTDHDGITFPAETHFVLAHR